MTATRHIPMQQVQRFSIGLGSIDPDARLAHHEITPNALASFLATVGDFYTNVVRKSDVIPCQCVDGRSRQDGSYEPEPKAAAGTFSLVVGDALTTNSFRKDGNDAAVHAEAIYTHLIRHGYHVGGHDADHASGSGCGCGAEDNLQVILEFIGDHGDEIQHFLKQFDIHVNLQTHRQIIRQAKSLLTESYIVPGVSLRQAAVTAGGAACIETLTGPHHEVALVINTEPGTTIDRKKLAAAYGDAFQVFELDLPALTAASKVLARTSSEAKQKQAAMLYYNAATAAVLAGPSLRVVLR